MDGLEGWRKKIDEIDRELMDLFERRMDLVANVAKYKEENNLPIFQEDREKLVIEKNLNHIQKEELKKYAEEFLQSLMDVSKEYQREKVINEKNKIKIAEIHEPSEKLDILKIGYGGTEGSFSEEALLKYFGENHKRKSYEEFEGVFVGLKNGEIDYGVVPIENSSTGAVNDVYDLLRKYGFYIVGEESISITQHLLGCRGSKIELIKEVYSHTQGLQQSSNFLKKYPEWKKIPNNNTALAAKLISETNDCTKAAIASKRAASIYGLDILKENINNEESNHTRFIVIGKTIENSKEKDRISVVFTLENKVGTLFNMLSYINRNGLNMVKIESRPVGKEPWKYYFYIDFQGNLEEDSVNNTLTLIQKNSSYYRLLGAFKGVSL
ncbi:prephenate dehydratase [Clostridium sp. 'White wine YQ']|uniref:prephenate dehydratase n=1 Tax=Clostridium sp. 'White wine YQ' TaxID=3027474 RepID=UPI002365FF64|nr:prephenate dehydratase [Clostridium sp. 'White wine YQ']MDD7794937.1 prephenate dehydratase [Clostridium sp. 'White wine YQ']